MAKTELERIVEEAVNANPTIQRIRREAAEREFREADPAWSPPKPASPSPPNDAVRLAALTLDLELSKAAAEAGVIPGALPDFVARAKDGGLARCPSPDPTRPARPSEYAAHLRRSGEAPHFWARGNGHAEEGDVW